MVVDLELVGLVACQLLWTGSFIWTLIDSGFFERKPIVADLGRDLNEDGKIECVYSGAGVGSFQGVVQGTGVESVEGSNRVDSHVQCAAAEKVSQGVGSIHFESGEGVSREVRGGEGEGPRDGEFSQEKPVQDAVGFREQLERRARECGLLGPRVKND